MVARKKSGGEKTEAQKQLIILAVYPEPVGLTAKELRTLEKALKTAGETSVESHERLETVVVIVPEQHSSRR